MSDRYRVVKTPRLVKWTVDSFVSSYAASKHPVYLDLADRNWSLVLQKYETIASLVIKHSPKLGGEDIGTHVIASFTIRVVSLTGGQKTLYHKEFRDKQLKSRKESVMWLGVPVSRKFIVQLEFLNLKNASPKVGELNAIAPSYLGKMFSESIHTDITICASDGTNIGAHRAILAARSPVFNSMFSHDLKEKNMSTINISDMSVEALRAFLTYMYSNIKYEDFIVHRLALLRAADKYCVSDLKDACKDSLLEDIDTNNVLERLQNAFLYGLPRLKVRCIQYLVKFCKINEIREDLNRFIEHGDTELVNEVIKEVKLFMKGSKSYNISIDS